MKLQRYFTKEMKSDDLVFDLFNWKKVSVKIFDYASGNILFEADDLEFPEEYSQQACDIIAKMYFRKSGVPGTGHETSMRQVAHRLCDFWVESMLDEGIIKANQAKIVYDELVYMLLAQMWAPNSPQWFNTGLMHAYGIHGEENGLSYYDPVVGKVVNAVDAYTRTQASACFIVGIEDSLLGDQSLMDNLTTASRLFKYGSGIGSNWSKIRGTGEKLTSGGKSSGLLSFQKVFDRNAGAIKSGGTTRRAAVMEVLDLDHPEITEFVQWKSREEDKVVALGKMGYDTSIVGEAYETVSGQNVNNSVSIPDEFMKLIESGDKNAQWRLKGRVDDSVDKDINAFELWEEIAWAAWRCGDPGVHFSDEINRWNTCPNNGRIRSSNPCSEYLFLDDTACNLASINIMKFYDAKKGFDLDGFLSAVSFIQLALEASIHWGAFPTKQIAYNTYKYRTTGIGLTNMGALVMALGLPYDSEEARSILAVLCSAMTGQSYKMSAKMAKEVGAFDMFANNREDMLAVIDKHRKAFMQTDVRFVNEFFKLEDMRKIENIWNSAYEVGEVNGYRNAQVSVLAPTGTIAFAMDCASTSSEPFFSHKVYKKVVDGSYMEIINDIIPMGLIKLGYEDYQIQEIIDYIMNGDGKIEGAPHLQEKDLPVFDTANRCGSGSRYLSPEAHVKMVAALQPHLSGGISKTVNLPADATVEDVKNIYMLAWKLGCKCIALYRDGSKVVQPLTTTRDNVDSINDIDNMNYMELIEYAKSLKAENDELRSKPQIERVKLPYEPKCIKNAVKMDGYTFHIQRSFYDDGRLGEIFATVGKQGDTVKGLMEVLCVLISKSLQYGIPAEVISKILRNTEFGPSGLVKQHPNIKAASSIPDLISKFIDISLGDYTYCQVKPETIESKNTDQVAFSGDNVDFDISKLIQKNLPVMDERRKELLNAYLESFGIRIEYPNTEDEELENPDIPAVEGVKVYGKVCSECGSNHIVKAGTCYYCADCGSSSGCS